MNFTREPIIETIISAKEGYKLSLKNSKNASQEEYLLDAVEVVSFGGSFFYRCQERPKAFFVPTSDYEIVEVRETKLLIKNPSVKDMIKIAGGKEASKQARQDAPSDRLDLEEVVVEEETPKEPQKTQGKPQEQKREKKRHRKKGRGSVEETKVAPVGGEEQKDAAPKEIPVALFSHLLQPPESLISETLRKYKKTEEVPSVPGISEELTSDFDISLSKESRLEDNVASQENVSFTPHAPENTYDTTQVLDDPSMHGTPDTEFARSNWEEEIEEKR